MRIKRPLSKQKQVSSRTKLLYWDANDFIALFNREETTKPEHLAALETTFEEMLVGHVRIVTCSMFRVEVFPKRLKEEGDAIYRELTACPHFEVIETLSTIMTLAGELREKCLDAKPRIVKLKQADAIHMAAGHVIGADEIWTSDEQLVRAFQAGHLNTTKVCFPHVDQIVLNL